MKIMGAGRREVHVMLTFSILLKKLLDRDCICTVTTYE
jgi:hypothetical protein